MKNRLNVILSVLFIILSSTQVSVAAETPSVCKSESESNKCVEVSVEDQQGKPLPDMVVYLQPLSGQSLPNSSQIVTISQENKAFSPYITVTQTYNKVKFVNQDEITHHIYSAGGSDNFAFKIQAGTEHLSESFEHETEVAMGCNIHDWMSGYLLVVDTPYFAKTDEQGHANFLIDQLGDYRVVVWHPQLAVENNRISEDHQITDHANFKLVLTQNLENIPTQSSSDDFDFLSDY